MAEASPSGPSELDQLLRARTIRERAERVFVRCREQGLGFFEFRESALAPLTERVLGVTRAAYPDFERIPYHSRLRHFEAGGVDRLMEFRQRLGGVSERARLKAYFDLVITSVLLDAGAGPDWSYTERETGRVFARSEGLAVASFRWFMSGGLSRDPIRDPLRVDAEVLVNLEQRAVERAFQVSDQNPLVGVLGRTELLRRLGEVALGQAALGQAALGQAALGQAAYFGSREPRPGNLVDALTQSSEHKQVRAEALLRLILDALGPIWPGREEIDGVNLGDVWTHTELGRIPFHKLSQWLTYSLCEPLEFAGFSVLELDALTGLPEYRNGGLFLDFGVLELKDRALASQRHAIGSDLIIEWRALTIALLDRLAEQLRRRMNLSAETLPLVKVLQGGTWRAGRELAAEKRPGAAPPLQVDSDGTVF